MKATRKLIPALALLLVSAVLLSTASYAWFTTNTKVDVSMSVGITTPANLNIRTEGMGYWTNTLALGELTALSAVSSADAVNFTAVNGAGGTGSVTIDGIVSYTKTVEGEGDDAVITFSPAGIAKGNYYLYGTNVYRYEDGTAANDVLVGSVAKATSGYYTQKIELQSSNAITASNLALSITVVAASDDERADVMESIRVAIIFTGAEGSESELAAGTCFVYSFANETADAIVLSGSSASLVEQGGTGTTYAFGTSAQPLTNVGFDAGVTYNATIVIWFEGNDADCVSANYIEDNLNDIVLTFQNNTPTT